MLAAIAASALLFLNVPSAQSAPVSLDCTAGSGSVSSSLATTNTNGATASDSLTVSNAPVGTTISLNYTATSNNNKSAQSTLASPAASGPSPAGPITINGSAGSGSQLWTKTTGADPVINVTLTKTAVAGGAATMNWSATCTPGRTLSITNTTDGAEAGPVNGVLTVAQTSISTTNTVVSLSYAGTATNTTDYSRPASVTIPAGSLSANVNLVVVDDAIVESPETVIVTLGTVTSGSAAVVAPVSATNTIASNDVGTINVTLTDNSATEALGDTGAFTISLSALPSANVTVTIGTSPQCARAPATLTFTTVNWNVAQTVIMTPNNDAVVEGPHTCAPATITAANGGYTGVTATPPIINITDNDVGTITVVTTDAAATEAPGNNGAFTVRLGFQPSASVTVSIGTSAQCNFSAATLTFTTANWATTQTVTVTPINDVVVEGAHTCSPASITAANGSYDGVTATPPTINITDNDVGTLVLATTDNTATETPGDTGAFTVRLGLQPSADVTVTIAVSAQCNFSPASLTFTTANWNVTQSVTVTPIDDAVAEGAHTCSPAPLTAANGGYNGVTAALPTINITDNDFGAINVTVTDNSATETPGDTGAFTISLSAQPSANVTVTIGTSPQCARAPTTLTFTTVNWNVAQTVIMTPNDDAVVEGPHTCAPATITAANGGYTGVTATPPIINITDNDVGTITVVTTDAAATEAPGNNGAFTVRLGFQPSASVTVSIGTSAQCNFSAATLTFTTANWATTQTVTVTPINDVVVEGAHTCSPASITAANGSYDGVTATPPTINITDNDVGTLVLATTDNTATETPGDTGAFTVRLGLQPSADVTVTIAVSAQCNFSPASLTFTTANWNVTQSVTVTPIDDAVAEGAHTCSPAPLTAANGGYNGVTAALPTINITDNDFGAINVTVTDNSATETPGDTGAFTISLSAQPSANVTVTIGTSPQCARAPTPLTFTTVNWNVAQTVIMTPNDDAVVEGPHTCAPATITAANGGYTGVTATPPIINITDNDVGTMTIVLTDDAATEAAGDTGAFTIVLNAQPSANVTVSIGTSPQCNRAPTSLTFTNANWNVARTVTITPINDTVVEGPHTCTQASITAAGGGYNGVTASPPTINITDNDIGTITLVTTDSNASEAGNTGAFTVRLGLQPSASVTVTIGTSPQCNFAAASLTFTTANWNTVQTVTATPIDDAVAEGAHTCSPASIAAAGGSYDGVTATPPTINIADNDVAGISISGASVTVTEAAGPSATFTVVLTSQPTGDVTVPLASSNIAEATVSPASLTFTATTWNIAQTVTVTGVNDAMDDGDVVSSITIGPTASSDTNYNVLTLPVVNVTTTDDDTAGITVSGGPLVVTEAAGPSATFTVVLTSQPTGDVTVPLASSNIAEATVSPASLTFTATNWNTCADGDGDRRRRRGRRWRCRSRRSPSGQRPAATPTTMDGRRHRST